MTDVAEDIVRALRRGHSPYSLADVWSWVRDGKCHLIIGKGMSCSWRIDPDDNQAEIVHVGGKWSDEDAKWLAERCKAAIGNRPWKWSGRKGWARFLRMRGFQI